MNYEPHFPVVGVLCGCGRAVDLPILGGPFEDATCHRCNLEREARERAMSVVWGTKGGTTSWSYKCQRCGELIIRYNPEKCPSCVPVRVSWAETATAERMSV